MFCRCGVLEGIAEADLIGAGIGPISAGPSCWAAGSAISASSPLDRSAGSNEGDECLPLRIVGAAHHGGFGHGRMAHQGGDSISRTSRWPDTLNHASSTRPITQQK